jgi:DNA-binding CsgD family transcriptional regulator
MQFLDQRSELEALESALVECLAGENRVLFIEGAAGSGKSELLEAFADLAAASGATVLVAAGSNDECGEPLAVVRQLLDRVPGAALPELAVQESGALTPESMRQVQTVLTDLADRGPVVCCVEDLQFVDAASRAFLLHLARRSRRSRILLVVTQAVHYGPVDAEFTTELLLMANLRRIPTRLMTVNEVAVAMTTFGGLRECATLAASLYAVTGGNPSLLRALFFEHGTALQHTDRAPADVEPQLGGMFAKGALICLQRCGRHALRLASALAVMGRPASLDVMSKLTDLTLAEIEQGLAGMQAAGLLDDGDFRHAVVRATVLDNIPVDTLAQLHFRAASLLYEAGVDMALVARHIVASGVERTTAGLPSWAENVLRTAANQAVTAGDVRRAIRLLEVSRAACGDPLRWAEATTQLAGVVWQLDPAASEQYLAEAVEAVCRAKPSAVRGRPLYQLLLAQGRYSEAGLIREMLTASPPGAADDEESLIPSGTDAAPADSSLSSMGGQLNPFGDSEPDLVAVDGFLRSTTLIGPMLIPIVQALTALVSSTEPHRGVDWCEAFSEQAQRMDAPGVLSLLSALKAQALLRLGDLEGAERNALAALEVLPGQKNSDYSYAPLATLLCARTLMGKYAEAAAIVNQQVSPRLHLTVYSLAYLRARARFYAATQQSQAALDDLFEIGRQMKSWGIDRPKTLPWRADAAEILIGLGRHREADRLLLQQLSEADANHPSVRGTTLRLRALMSEARRRPELLNQAVADLARSGDRLQLAQAKADLSKALQAVDDPLAGMVAQEALVLAAECKAAALCEQIQHVLVPAQSRHRAGETHFDSALQSLRATLSDSERRVATLAALKYSNREIAEALHITTSTVEQHLTRIYRKLGISTRGALRATLELNGMEA